MEAWWRTQGVLEVMVANQIGRRALANQLPATAVLEAIGGSGGPGGEADGGNGGTGGTGGSGGWWQRRQRRHSKRW